jgi:hypothetical protein
MQDTMAIRAQSAWPVRRRSSFVTNTSMML